MVRYIPRAPLGVVAALAITTGSLAAQSASMSVRPLEPPETYSTPIPAFMPRPEFWLPDEPVSAGSLAFAHGRLYFGGRFTQVGPFTGPFAVADSATGSPILSWPRTDGHVNVVIPDGAGGWWLGGAFSRIGTETRANVAHVLSDGNVDRITIDVGSEVFSLALAGTTLYVGGNFQVAGATTRRMAAAIDTTTGRALPWNPFPLPMGGSDRILRILVDGGTVYLAGYFDSPASFPHRHLVAVDAITGALVPGWTPDPDGMVSDLVLSGPTLYVGGNFTQISGFPRNRLAALDIGTVTPSPFDPGFDSTVLALELSGTTLYVGGNFFVAAGQSRGCGAAFDTVSGNLLAWDPQAALEDGTSLAIEDLLVAGATAFVCGSFRSVGGQRQYGVGRLDATTGVALPWSGDAGGPESTEVFSIALQGGHLACAGDFQIFGGERREGAAALDLATGQLAPWNPSVHGVAGPIQVGNVLSIHVDGDTAWLGGQFSYVNGEHRELLASVDAHTGATNLAFDPGFFHSSGFVRSLAKTGRRLFAGGGFNTPIPGQSNLIALDTITGAIVPGSTSVGPSISDMVLSPDGTRLYLAGSINSVGDPPQARLGLAAINTLTGAPLAWDPDANQIGREVHYEGGRVWATGLFTSVGGVAQAGLSSIDPITGTVAAEFAPAFMQNGSPSTASSLAFYEDTLIVAGGFDVVSGFERDSMAAFDSVRGSLFRWVPVVGSVVTRVEVGGGVLVALAPSIRFPTGELRPRMAVYDAP